MAPLNLKVYVAGASAEIDRAETVIAELLCHPGIELTEDWPAKIRAAQHKDGEDLRQDQAAVRECAQGVLACDVLLLLAPAPGVHSAGLWWELGLACQRRWMSEWNPKMGDTAGPTICWSGPRRGILWTVAHWYTTEDSVAIQMVVAASKVRGHCEAQLTRTGSRGED